MEDDQDYEVGYGRHPEKTRFKKGQSGNPKGRPKGKKNLAEIIRAACFEPVKVKDDKGQVRTMPKIKVIATQLANSAAKGDLKATKAFLEILKQFGMLEPEPEPQLHTRPICISYVASKDGKPAPEPEGSRVYKSYEEWRKREVPE